MKFKIIILCYFQILFTMAVAQENTQEILSATTEKGCTSGNCIDGFGTMIYASGNKYIGEWKNSTRHGSGTFYYGNGCKYNGEYRFDERQGFGTYYYASGNKYVGEWKDGKKHGKGTFYYEKSGHKYIGEWKENKKHGNGMIHYPDGKVVKGIWKDDKLVKKF